MNFDIVDAGAPGRAALVRHGGQHVALTRRGDEVDRTPGRHGGQVIAIAGEREGTVGERENESAVADRVTIEHVGSHRHVELRVAGTDFAELHAERLRRAVARIHFGGHALGQHLSFAGRKRRVMLAHDPYFPVKRGDRLSPKAATPSRKSSVYPISH